MTANEPANRPADDDPKSRVNRTLTVGEVMDRLSRLDRSLPVVFEAVDEPSGNYGVRDVSVVPMQRQSTFAAQPYGCDVYSSPEGGLVPAGDYYDEPGPVAFLSMYREQIPTRQGDATEGGTEGRTL
ncbi:hypothetical protein MTY66_60960 (plasmid) [Mycolicibacterium sp. TY66]|jgi:hypothetical protein|uniref:hypothetical protein n=1 Tax=unclassified Mycolicibacterium TaxID=2636767 RepID=UPI001BB349E1|nr:MULTISPECIES: hypothetical protein [unclassified Mycolicibacterium]BCI84471.1 hypothetical protein MTY66_60960 [Mycolicibacterium sp. TY66]BCJ84703.1 hypothetical protein MTY81_60760 [Mycolicibacterium sp. TY81]